MSDSKALTPQTEKRDAVQDMRDFAQREDVSVEERSLAFRMADQLERSRLVRSAAVQIANESWGKGLSQHEQAAVARYALELGTDPVRHWFVLGGNVYDRAELWYDLIAAHPGFLRPEEILLHHDDRLTPEKAEERKALRAQYGVPEQAKGAALVRLHFQGGRGPFEGVNWAGAPGKKDPVGEQEPTKTAITRAWRKAAKKAAPLWFRKHPAWERVSEVLDQGHQLRAGPSDDGHHRYDVPGVGTVRERRLGAGGPPIQQPADPYEPEQEASDELPDAIA